MSDQPTGPQPEPHDPRTWIYRPKLGDPARHRGW